MGWRFRKSFNMGPIRWNLSRRGVGGSWGFPGFRVGVSADGRRYISVGIPGTGLYYQRYFGGGPALKPGGSPITPPNSGPIPVPDLSCPSSAPMPVVLPPVGPSKPPNARLVAKRDGLPTGQAFDIAQRTVIGRAGTSSDQIDVDLAPMPEAAYVSARHAEIRYEHSRGWIIRDLGSQNGSFIRRAGTSTFHRMIGEEMLRDGDEVAFGNARFEFQVPGL